jgi:hypothetical protein
VLGAGVTGMNRAHMSPPLGTYIPVGQGNQRVESPHSEGEEVLIFQEKEKGHGLRQRNSLHKGMVV